MTDVICAVAINKVYPDGMKTIGFCLELSEETSDGEAEQYTFEVWDRSYEPAMGAIQRTVKKISCPERKKILLEMDTTEKAAYAIGNYKMDGTFDPFGPGNLGFEDPKRTGMKQEIGKKEAQKGPGKDFGYTGPKPFFVEIHVKKEEKTEQIVSCHTWTCAELERFEVREQNGQKYLLYIPQDYDAGKKYPLILFIVDAAGRGTYEKGPLVQGTGALVWTEPKEQEKHPCFVMAPVYGPEDILTHDDFTFDTKLYKVKEVIDALQMEYSIDPKRIYTTGQSMGCMGSCQLMIQYPSYFSGAMLVAGQWEPQKSGAALKDNRAWILVSENDKKAYPGMNAVVEELTKQGGVAEKYFLDAKLPQEELEKEAEKEAEGGANIKYTVFDGSSVVPEGTPDGPGANHTCTWRIAYNIEAVRDWLFEGAGGGRDESI